MLKRLAPDEVKLLWTIIEPWVKGTISPDVIENEKTVANIYGALLGRVMEAWLIYEEEVPLGLIVTELQFDKLSETRIMLINSLIIPNKLKKETWLNAIDTIRDYTKMNGCGHITAFTTNPMVVSLAKRLGNTKEIIYLKIEV